jgi:Family of unknown function (DUF6627)
MRKNPFMKLLSIYLMLAMLILTLPTQGWAMFITTGHPMTSRQADLSTIQRMLETNLIRQRLMDYGLSAGDAQTRVKMLSNEQIHQLAMNLNSLQAGADDGLGFVIFLLVAAIITVIVLEATGHRVIITK